MYLFVSVCIGHRSVCSLALFVCVCLDLFVFLLPYVCLPLSVCLCDCVDLPISVCLRVCLYGSVCLIVYPSVCLSACLSVCLSICLWFICMLQAERNTLLRLI